MKKRIAVSVSNDLSTDQRVRKQCNSLTEARFDILLLGRKLKDSTPLERPYEVERFKLLFNKKAPFYAALNVRLFFRLLFARVDVFYANDLDTLPANALLSLLRRKPLVYDSHEFFTEVPEVNARPAVKKVWTFFERICIRRADHVLTVNKSIADLLMQIYGCPAVDVVRNVPETRPSVEPVSREELGLPTDKKIIILQGSGINLNRGSEELLEAVALTSGVVLLFVGSGDALSRLSDLPEVRAFAESSGAGTVAERLDPEYLADLITSVLADSDEMKRKSAAALKATESLNWAAEYQKTVDAVKRLAGD
ncbi:MAG: glycosyltransferase [Flavobacteriales bacterium]|nr:glycosyltransferase [Flavobacteriales bacterium]